MTREEKNTCIVGILGVTFPGSQDCIQKFRKLAESEAVLPPLVYHQLDFSMVKPALENEDWMAIEEFLLDGVKKLEMEQVSFVIIPANTVHVVLESLQNKSLVPIINMIDAAAEKAKDENLKKVAVLGTSWTIKYHLYKKPLESRSIAYALPNDDEQKTIQNAILNELVPNNHVSEQTIFELTSIVERLSKDGCDGVILACTELPIVLNEKNCVGIKVLDTNSILAIAAFEKAKQIENDIRFSKLII
ncbi:MAG: hypothetical protein A3F42_03050 [Gammaproteobacteria bacterium RIFCSPHIGHO2_12_FULL_37_34]|nr:MAG: hypothetical protein A3F42_03050 [Gammaproteobacteria bacterium RIFCSPHIGHO2_12_FULL_37_34]